MSVDDRCMRPNIIINNSIPFEEDRWLNIRIGDTVEFVCYRPCTRLAKLI